MDTAEHLEGLRAALVAFVRYVDRAGLAAAIPTTPDWTVRELVAHQGMVHRWATAVVHGEDPRTVDSTAIEAEGRASTDPVGWLLDGAAPLVAALRTAPDDLPVMTFLEEAPPARAFWARRQGHESTVHALDALAAREGRLPTAADAWFDESLASDGIDELLVGFWQRRASGPRSRTAYTALVSVTAGGPAWTLAISPESPVTRRLAAPAHARVPADARTLGGSATDLYLALWNRGGTVDDPSGLLDSWREGGSVTW